jgi:hypothetical protein
MRATYPAHLLRLDLTCLMRALLTRWRYYRGGHMAFKFRRPTSTLWKLSEDFRVLLNQSCFWVASSKVTKQINYIAVRDSLAALWKYVRWGACSVRCDVYLKQAPYKCCFSVVSQCSHAVLKACQCTDTCKVAHFFFFISWTSCFVFTFFYASWPINQSN